MPDYPPAGRPRVPHAPSAGRWLALVILCAATLMVILDGTIVTVALPTIQRALGFTARDLSWVVDSYLVAFGGLLLLSGRLGDLLGRRRMFLAGLAVFVLASLTCGLSVSPAMLIVARFAQGIGGAMATAVTLGMIIRLFPGPAEQPRAIGAYAFTGAAGASVGLISGGLLVQYANWHWIFFVNLPIGLATWIAAWWALPADSGLGLRAGADAPGALLATSGLMLVVFAIASPSSWWAGTAGALLLAAFAVRQATARTPLLPPRALASRNVIGANLALLLVIGAAQGFQVTVTLYMQRALRFGPAESGLGLAPTAVVIAAIALGLSAPLVKRFGARRLLLAGLVMIAVALAPLTKVPVHALYASRLLPTFVVFGVGAGFTLTTVTALGMSGATDADAGVVSGAFNTMQQVGAALGVALLTSLAASRTGGGTSAQALTSGYRLAFAVAAMLACASLAVAALVLRERRPSRKDTAQAATGPSVSAADRR